MTPPPAKGSPTFSRYLRASSVSSRRARQGAIVVGADPLDAKTRLDEFKAKAQRRADQVDADFAASDADWAEADAYDAIDYADWAVDSARVAILDAIDARVYADEKAGALV
jgi:hypothetical protein